LSAAHLCRSAAIEIDIVVRSAPFVLNLWHRHATRWLDPEAPRGRPRSTGC
jgi:hypothetical protein